MRLVRFALLSGLTGASVLAGASVASAQTTTVPPVPPIPVTGGQATTTTTAPASSESGGSSGALAETGMAADVLVPFGFALVGAGAVLQVASRRPREAHGLL